MLAIYQIRSRRINLSLLTRMLTDIILLNFLENKEVELNLNSIKKSQYGVKHFRIQNLTGINYQSSITHCLMIKLRKLFNKIRHYLFICKFQHRIELWILKLLF